MNAVGQERRGDPRACQTLGTQYIRRLRSRQLVLAVRIAATLTLGVATASLWPQHVSGQSSASVAYLPSSLGFQVYETDHFDIIFDSSSRASAAITAQYLEQAYDETIGLFGERPTLRMPVVVTSFSDEANAFVSPFVFRQEYVATPLYGNRMPPTVPNWLGVAAPHELTHAVQADRRAHAGIGRVVRFFSRDAARVLNLLVPRGAAEGLAVFRESSAGGGRLDYSQFTMRYRAAMAQRKPWNVAQHLEAPLFERPFGQQPYLGGSHVLKHLAGGDSSTYVVESTALQDRIPFLGYGTVMWAASGRSPRRIGRELTSAALAVEQTLESDLGPFVRGEVVASRDGDEFRTPRWTSDSTVVVYLSGYHGAPGFFTVDVNSGNRKRLNRTRLNSARQYSLRPDGTIVFARSRQDYLVETKRTTDVFAVSENSTGSVVTTRLTSGARIVGAVSFKQSLYGLGSDGGVGAIVRLADNNVEAKSWTFPNAHVERLEVRRDAEAGQESLYAVAVVGNGQAIYLVSFDADGTASLQPRIVPADGSIFDICWSGDGRVAAFASDVTGIANAYLWYPETGRVTQQTSVQFGVLDPCPAPDGRHLAYVEYQHGRFDLMRAPISTDEVVANQLFPIDSKQVVLSGAKTAPRISQNVRPYRALSHLGPRVVVPFFPIDAGGATGASGVDLGVGFGLAVSGADPLLRHAYRAAGYIQDSRLWGDVEWSSARLPVVTTASVFRNPTAIVVLDTDSTGNQNEMRLGRAEIGASLGLSLPLFLQRNARVSSITLGVSAKGVRRRLFDDDGFLSNTRLSRTTLEPSLAFNGWLRRNLRAMQPTSGVSGVVRGLADASTSSGRRRRALVSQVNIFLPVVPWSNASMMMSGAILTQNTSGVYNLESFVPRGFEDAFVGSGTYFKAGATFVQPLAYPENGTVWIPAFFHAIYAYGFGENMARWGGDFDMLTSVGGGVGLKFRFFYYVELDVRLGLARRLEDDEWRVVVR